MSNDILIIILAISGLFNVAALLYAGRVARYVDDLESRLRDEAETNKALRSELKLRL